MEVHYWETPIEATWHNANHLEEANIGKDDITIRISDEKTGRIWSLQFERVKAFKILSDECAEWSTKLLPPDSGFFTITNSPWFSALGLGSSDPDALDSVTHYVICCEEAIVEVLAHDSLIT